MALELNGTTGITSDGGTPVIENLDTTATGIAVTGELTTTGNVGIGTSAPGSRLDARTSGVTVARFQSTAANGGYMTYVGGSTTYIGAPLAFLGTGTASDFGIVGSGANNFVFGTSSAEKMRITAAGNLGINTNAPARTLHVKGGGVTTLGNSNGALFTDAGNGGVLLGSDNAIGYISGVTVAGNATANLVLQPFGNNLLVNTTSQNDSSQLSLTVESGKNGIGFSVPSTADTGNIIFRNPNGVVGRIYTSGSSTGYATSSDYRLKEDWVAVADASTRVNALKPVNFAWIASGERVDGFLAHELAEVVPEAATGSKDAMRDEEYEITPRVMATYDEESNELTPAVEAVMGTRSVPDYQGIDQSKLVPLLTAALQEALAAIDDLTARVSALEVK